MLWLGMGADANAYRLEVRMAQAVGICILIQPNTALTKAGFEDSGAKSL